MPRETERRINMKIIIDAFGGDNAPLAPLQGARLAAGKFDLDIIAVGDIDKMKECCSENGIDTSRIEFLQADGVFDMERDPMEIVKKRTDTSLHIAFKALSEGKGDAVVSAGSTGAILMGSTFIVRRIRGCKRPAIGSVMPCETPGGFMLIDCGANTEARPEMLRQFAIMGSVYMEKVAGRKSPRIALLNNGTEETKGPESHVAAYSMMKEDPSLNFVGNIEGRDVMGSVADVVVADGFSGNIALKTAEGVAAFITGRMKGMFLKSLKTKIAALLLKNELKEFKKQFDYKEYGGAPVLGVRKCVIKAHGSSDASAFMNAIRQAKTYVENDVSAVLRESLGGESEE